MSWWHGWWQGDGEQDWQGDGEQDGTWLPGGWAGAATSSSGQKQAPAPAPAAVASSSGQPQAPAPAPAAAAASSGQPQAAGMGPIPAAAAAVQMTAAGQGPNAAAAVAAQPKDAGKGQVPPAAVAAMPAHAAAAKPAAAPKAGQGLGRPVVGGVPSPLGHENDLAREVFDLDFFERFTVFTGSYKQRNAALKYFRDVCERENSDGFRFSNQEKAAVAAIVHPKGMSFEFDGDDMREWSWLEMVGQLDRESLAYVVEDGDRSRGLVACEIRWRPGSYDHKRHHEKRLAERPEEHITLPVWDFVLIRSDQSGVRLHPQWSTPKVETYAVEGHETEVRIPTRGVGESDGPGTYKHFKVIGCQRMLRFGRRT